MTSRVNYKGKGCLEVGVVEGPTSSVHMLESKQTQGFTKTRVLRPSGCAEKIPPGGVMQKSPGSAGFDLFEWNQVREVWGFCVNQPRVHQLKDPPGTRE